MPAPDPTLHTYVDVMEHTASAEFGLYVRLSSDPKDFNPLAYVRLSLDVAESPQFQLGQRFKLTLTPVK